MKILIDVSLSPQRVPFLLKHGLEAVHWSTVGQNSAPDCEMLNHAERHGFVVRAIESARSHLDSGALVTIDSERQRIRMLPL